MGYYQQQITLHDLVDVEDLCVRSARGWCERTGARLSPIDFEELVVDLVAGVWRMSERYDPRLSSSFEAIVRNQLANRCVDWFRRHAGRTRWQFSDHVYERDVERPISFDALRDSGSEVGVVDAGLEGDPSAADLADLCGGLLADRSREVVRDTSLIRTLAGRILQVRVDGDDDAKREWIDAQKSRFGEMSEVEEVMAA